MIPVLAILGLFALLLAGAAAAAVLDRLAYALAAGRPLSGEAAAPFRAAAAQLARQRIATERPDAVGAALAPAAYLALAAIGMSVVPLAEGVAVVEIETGIVLWGACEALTIVVVFLHGWSANAPLPLIGAYRYVAIGLPAMLLSMFVLIGVALPAQSLSVIEVVRAQEDVWNVVRQPLGLVLFLMLGLTLSLRGPFDYADPADLAGGTSADASGPAYAVWRLARLCMLVSVSAMASAAFLGGPLGPWLPGPLWLALKMLVVLAILIAAGRLLARTPPARMLTLIWVVLLPLAFLQLAIAGVGALP
ncbi:NADH-quinone oxidoreductase subunit H [Salinarimonas sp.]|uniref:NADH-quinone oxidoreductase subunit H n=1 Tax=Salinarimonas sp. TaxID=2766526 RepID=UPI0032D8F77C